MTHESESAKTRRPTALSQAAPVSAIAYQVAAFRRKLPSDFSFDCTYFIDELTRHPATFDDSYTRWGPIEAGKAVEFGRPAI